MTLPIQYAFEGTPVRIVMVQGEPWFVASDVASALHYAEAKDMTRNLDSDEKGRQIVPTPGGDQEVLVINEPGLYSAVLRSRKPEAKRFKRWVTHEVLPTIRKHGAYVMPETLPEAPTQEAPTASHVGADQIVSAGRAFNALFRTARHMGMPRRLAATRANQAARRVIGVDLAAELGAIEWLEAPDLPEPQRRQYELQQRIRQHLVANDWPQGFTTQHILEALALPATKGSQMAVGQALQLLGYNRVRLNPPAGSAIRPWGYVLSQTSIMEASA